MKVEVAADSISPQGHRLFSIVATFPRIILSELNTHRALSKNSASSRAIPFKKMVETVKSTPFIPIAWQKEHKGMQGTEYFDDTRMLEYEWLEARNKAVVYAESLSVGSQVTKQLCNRLLEPFMYHTAMISGTDEGWQNFFNLRCPQYTIVDEVSEGTIYFRSWSELVSYQMRVKRANRDVIEALESYNTIEKLKCNKGQAEIHMMDLAESIWDAWNDSKPKQLNAGEWHIPFEDKIVADWTEFEDSLYNGEKISWRPGGYKLACNEHLVKLSTAMAARTSYTTVGEEKSVNYQILVGIHDKMANADPFHASPFEHCARAMDKEEYESYSNGQLSLASFNTDPQVFRNYRVKDSAKGWCRNYRGFIQYRHDLEKYK